MLILTLIFAKLINFLVIHFSHYKQLMFFLNLFFLISSYNNIFDIVQNMLEKLIIMYNFVEEINAYQVTIATATNHDCQLSIELF